MSGAGDTLTNRSVLACRRHTTRMEATRRRGRQATEVSEVGATMSVMRRENRPKSLRFPRSSSPR